MVGLLTTVVIRSARAPHRRAGNALCVGALSLIGLDTDGPLLVPDHPAGEHVLPVGGGLVGPTCVIGTLSNLLVTLPRCFFVALAFRVVGHTGSRATIRILVLGSLTGTFLRLTGNLADLSRFGAQRPGSLPGTLACGLTCLFGGPSGTFTDLARSLACSPADVFGGLPGTFAHLARSRANALGRLPDPLADIADRLASAFAYVADSLASALAYIADSLTGAFADLTDRVTGTFAYIMDRLADLAHRVTGTFAHVTDSLASALADLAHRVTGAFTHVTDSLAGTLADLAHRVARARAHVADRFARA
ncbi:hypothetical protein Hesp01_22060 [Herbidospora sp. NBRC 101105]|nr:hypothetical protein Hesp01_22060 [Herbidospora sp. NBRC 101105]